MIRKDYDGELAKEPCKQSRFASTIFELESGIKKKIFLSIFTVGILSYKLILF